MGVLMDDIYGWMGELIDGWADVWMDERIQGQTGLQTDEYTERSMYGKMEGRADG